MDHNANNMLIENAKMQKLKYEIFSDQKVRNARISWIMCLDSAVSMQPQLRLHAEKVVMVE